MARRLTELHNAHFGHAEFFSIIDVSDVGVVQLVQTRHSVDRAACVDGAGGTDGFGYGRRTDNVSLLADCCVVVAGRVEPRHRRQLAEFDIRAVEADGPGLLGCEWLLVPAVTHTPRVEPDDEHAQEVPR